MNKSEFISLVSEKTDLTKVAVEKAYNEIFNTIKEELGKGHDVAVAGFGTFKVKKRAARNGINPLTKQPLKIPARNAVSFKAGTALKDKVN